MGWSKREFIVRAFGRVGLQEADLSPEQFQEALETLDSMMAEWNGLGIRLGYPVPSTANGSDLAHDSGVPDRANLTITLNLALLLADSIGRQLPPKAHGAAARGYNWLLSRSAVANPIRLSNTVPAGAGNKGRVFLQPSTDQIEVGPDGVLDFE